MPRVEQETPPWSFRGISLHPPNFTSFFSSNSFWFCNCTLLTLLLGSKLSWWLPLSVWIGVSKNNSWPCICRIRRNTGNYLHPCSPLPSPLSPLPLPSPIFEQTSLLISIIVGCSPFFLWVLRRQRWRRQDLPPPQESIMQPDWDTRGLHQTRMFSTSTNCWANICLYMFSASMNCWTNICIHVCKCSGNKYIVFLLNLLIPLLPFLLQLNCHLPSHHIKQNVVKFQFLLINFLKINK